GRRVLLFQGRAHYYETGDAGAMRIPVSLVKELGIPVFVATNAAGSVRADIRPGSLVAISDHLNLSGTNPLLRDHSDGRFVSLTGAYDEGLRRTLKKAAERSGIALPEGVYAWLSGPSFETPAEIKMVQILGGDLVGMSTVPEVILA
ncbi:purine-nucleoside phosphorylase, partial [Corallococcus exiguus]|nr:purine-nucleoside phosphorylase [Corallococcus exiguus]